MPLQSRSVASACRTSPTTSDVVADRPLVAKRDEGLRRPCLLRLQGVTIEEWVEFRLAAGEVLDRVPSIELLDAQAIRHRPASKTEGSRNGRGGREWRRGGASERGHAGVHFAASRTNTRRSAKRSSASRNAASNTNSLIDLRAAAAAPCNVSFAALLRRRDGAFPFCLFAGEPLKRLMRSTPDNVKTNAP